jgi:hypothetical protein
MNGIFRLIYSYLKMDQIPSFKDKKTHSFEPIVPSFQIWSLHGYLCCVKNLWTCLVTVEHGIFLLSWRMFDSVLELATGRKAEHSLTHSQDK